MRTPVTGAPRGGGVVLVPYFLGPVCVSPTPKVERGVGDRGPHFYFYVLLFTSVRWFTKGVASVFCGETNTVAGILSGFSNRLM